jgi:hypothetical protein
MSTRPELLFQAHGKVSNPFVLCTLIPIRYACTCLTSDLACLSLWDLCEEGAALTERDKDFLSSLRVQF